MPTNHTFLNLKLPVTDRAEVLEAVRHASAAAPVRITTPNPEIMVQALRNRQLAEALESSTHSLIDGFGLAFWMGLWHRLKRLPGKISRYQGSDLVQDLFQQYQDGSKGFYLIGGIPGQMNACVNEIELRFPGVRIIAAESGGKIPEAVGELNDRLLKRINTLEPDILLVGFGAPKQEVWISKAASRVSVPVMVGIGGSLLFYGLKPRAPRWMRQTGLEWAYRSVVEPRHWRRLWRAIVVFSAVSLAWIVRNLFATPKLRS